jgi:parvulin-like peptidyl-prolyl isomerase
MSLTFMRRKFRKAIRPVLLGIAGVFFLSCFTMYGTNMFSRIENKGGEHVVAKVNGEEVPADLYQRSAAMMLRQYEQVAQMQNTRVDFGMQHQARGRAFESVVDSYLRAQAAEREGIDVSRGEVRKAIDTWITDEMSGKMEGATAEEKRQFEEQLRRLRPEDLQRKQLLIENLDKKLRERFKPTDQEVINSYNEVKARHILIKTLAGGKDGAARPDAEAKKKIEELLAKVRGGQDFAKLAKETSEDTNSKPQGGDVGWVSAEAPFVAEFKTAALKLKKGEVSEPVKTMFGYHLIKADEVRSKLPKDFNDPKKKEEYRAQIEERLVKERMDQYYTALKAGAKIEPFDPFVKGFIAENEANGLAQAGDMKAYEAKIKEAAVAYEEAAAKNQLDSGPALWAKLAQLYNNAKQDDKALAAVNRALDQSRSAELYVTKGEIYERKKNTPEAVKAYEEAMKISYDQPWQYTNLQLKFKALKRDDLAKQAYAKWQAFVKEDDSRRAREKQAATPGK